MKKICCIFNCAPHYRREIYGKIDEKFDCRFVFGDAPMGQKGIITIPPNTLRNSRFVKNRIFIKSPIYWQSDIFKELLVPMDAYIMIGEPFCISTWLFAAIARFFFRKRVLFWTIGWFGRENFFKKIIKKIFFRLPNALLLYGNYAKKLMVKEGFDERRLFVIHNSLSYSRQIEIRNSIKASDIYNNHFKNNSKNLVFVGRLAKAKKLDEIMQLIPELKKAGVDANITFVGDGAERKQLEDLAEKLGIENNVWFYGACYDELKNAELLYNADLCISPGNVGLTAMHALMFGCPVATHGDFKFQAPEFESIVDGTTGVFFKRDDILDMVRVIKKWFSDGKPRDEIRKAAFKEIDLSWNPNYQIKILEEALK